MQSDDSFLQIQPEDEGMVSQNILMQSWRGGLNT
jgi:hypothetical protein